MIKLSRSKMLWGILMSTKKNPYTYRKGTSDAEMKFGHCTADNEIDAILRSGYFHDHYISLGATGDSHRKGGTICKSPGSFQVKAGTKVSGNDNGVMIKAENGNIHISHQVERSFLMLEIF